MGSIFITGVSGFIGRAIAEEAVRQGYEVSGLDLSGSKIPGVKTFKGDIRDKELMLKLTKNVDYVMHIAAITSNLEFEKRLWFGYDVNVNGFNSVIEAAYTNGCKKFLYASSSAVYNNEFSEDAVIDIAKMTNHYAKTKLINEAVGKSYRSLKLLDATGMRFFNVYGPGENAKGNYASIVTIFRNCKKANKPIEIYGNGMQRRDLIYVTDVAKISLMLLKKGGESVYNLGTGKSTTYKEIAQMVGSDIKYRDNPLSTYQLLTQADTTRLLKAIGNYKFITVREGIARLAQE